MESEARLEAGYPLGAEHGFGCEQDDVTTRSQVPDLIVLQEHVGQNGKVLTSEGVPLTTPEGRQHIYVVGDCGKIHVALGAERREPGAVKHNTLLRAQSCYGAGEITFQSGVIVRVNARSGSYRPPVEILPFVRELLQRAGAAVDDNVV